MVLLELPAGFHTIRARAFGWEDASVSVFIEEDTIVPADIVLQPATFRLENASQSRRRFNPLNSGNLGVTEYRFEVSAPGSGLLKILDQSGSVVYSEQLQQFNTWVQHITWNGRDSSGNLLPQGSYTVVIEASPLPEFTNGVTQIISINMETELASTNIFPQSLDGGIAGLVFSPLPHVLPAGSYQFTAGVHFCSAEGTNILPFNLGLRISPFDRFELTSVFNINPHLENQTGWGVSGSVMYNFFDGSGSFPLALSAGISYTWASSTGEHPLGAGRGIGLYAPLSLELSIQNLGQFSIILCPSIFWYGPESLIPKLLLSAGVLYRGSWLTGGLSMRYEFDFTDGISPKIFTGAEVHIFPPPSNFVFSLRGGMWTQDSVAGGFGGLGIGIIF
jgi:hypothetical protein